MLTLEQIKQALADRKLQMVAESTYLHVNTVRAYARGTVQRPSHDAMRKLSKYLSSGVTAVPDWLEWHAAQIYQACGAYDLPERVLDNLSDMVDGKEPRHRDILPCNPPVTYDPMEG